MKRLLTLLCALALFVACGSPEDEAEDTADEGFVLSGEVIAVEDGAEPENVTELPDVGDAGPADDADERSAPDSPGAIVVDPESQAAGLTDCSEPDDGGYSVYYTEDTRFVPGDLVDDESFPDNLKNLTVEVTGTRYSADAEGADASAGCVLVAQSISSADGQDGDGDRVADETFTPGPRSPTPDGQPDVSPLETSEATASP